MSKALLWRALDGDIIQVTTRAAASSAIASAAVEIKKHPSRVVIK